jgi:uncharacterized protein (TIGR03437 family)
LVACGVNAASQWPGLVALIPEGTVAPGELFTIYGTGLDGARVLFDGIPAPLLYAQANQINLIVPFAVHPPSTVMIVERAEIAYGPYRLPVTEAAPAIFSADLSGNGQAAALNEDGTLNSPANPARRGSIITLYATGAGVMDPPMADGSVAPASLPLPKPRLGVSVLIGSFQAPVEYAGAAPGMLAGAIQLNVRVPDAAPPGDAVPVVVYVGNYGSGVPGVPYLPGRVTVAVR